MTDPKRTCGNCDYFTSGANGHGTCHVAAPGSIARNGFPIIAAGDWCAKGATGGMEWTPNAKLAEKDAIINGLVESLKRVIVEDAIRVALEPLKAELPLVVQLMQRNLWQRICNTVPWEGK